MKSATFGILKFVLLSALITGWFVTAPAKSYACSCAPPGTPAKALAGATAVFTGTVVDIKEPFRKPFRPMNSLDLVEVTFQVGTMWKGPLDKTLMASTAASGASCGFRFQEGYDYIVYAWGEESDLWAGLCSRTGSLSHAAEDLKQLGEGRAPSSDGSNPEAEPTLRVPSTCSAPLGEAKSFDIGWLLLLGLPGLVFAKRRR